MATGVGSTQRLKAGGPDQGGQGLLLILGKSACVGCSLEGSAVISGCHSTLHFVLSCSYGDQAWGSVDRVFAWHAQGSRFSL